MLFKIEKDTSVLESNPELQAFPKMSLCSDRELRWIFFVYDYETPLRKLPMEARKEKAADLSGFLRERGSGRLDKNARNTISGKISKVNEAVEEFMGIQYDQDKEMVAAYDAQISDAIELMKKKDKDDKDWSTLMKINKELPTIRKMKTELEIAIGYRVEETTKTEEEDDQLSTLDMFHEEEDL